MRFITPKRGYRQEIEMNSIKVGQIYREVIDSSYISWSDIIVYHDQPTPYCDIKVLPFSLFYLSHEIANISDITTDI